MACPSTQELENLTLGLLSGGAAGSLEEHIASCKVCGQTLQGLATDDTLLAALRGRLAEGEEPEIVSRLIEDLHAMPSRVVLSREATATLEPDPEELAAILAPAQEPHELGRLGRYSVLKVLGVGGMGIVFLAEDAQLKRQVALKAMRPHIAVRRSARQRFAREAQAAAAIEHEHVVTIYEVGEDRGIPYFAMQYLRGETLHARLKRESTLPIKEALRIGREVAQGLAAAHAQGLIHRDIKPENIWLDPQGRVKLLDFGLARLEVDGDPLTVSGDLLGTPQYMSPEQLLPGDVDERCDLFSLGNVLYSCLVGRLPFAGGDVSKTLTAVLQHSPQPPRALRPDVPLDVERLVLSLLEKDPGLRPQTAAGVVTAIDAIESGQPIVLPSRRAPTRWFAVALVAALVVISLAGIVLRWSTDRGDLVIESNDPRIEVAFRDASIKIVDQESKRTYDLRFGRQRLPSGDYAIEVEEGGLRFETKEFKIERTAMVSIRAWIEDTAGAFDEPRGAKGKIVDAGGGTLSLLAEGGHVPKVDDTVEVLSELRGPGASAFGHGRVMEIEGNVFFLKLDRYSDELLKGTAVRIYRDDENRFKRTQLQVPVTQAWTKTGITAKTARFVTITALGAIDGAPADDMREYYHGVPPQGRGERLEQFPYPRLPGLALIGRLGDGEPFHVGASRPVSLDSAAGDAELQLGINDDNVTDNSGQWLVHIVVREPVTSSR